jgi:hypothetical protein
MALVLAVISGVSWEWRKNVQLKSAIDALQNELVTKRENYMRARRDTAWWAKHQADYQRLIDTGFVGNDARAVWYQNLYALSSMTGVYRTEFDIAAHMPHQPEQRIGKRILMDTSVHWRGEIAHEGVLIDVLARLAAVEHGMFSVHSCDLTHDSDSAPIGVDCMFVWQVLERQ